MNQNNYTEYVPLWSEKDKKYKIYELRNIHSGLEEDELVAECFEREVAEKICFILSNSLGVAAEALTMPEKKF